MDKTTSLPATQTAPQLRHPAATGLTLMLAGFLPVMVIVSLAPAVPAMVMHFAGIPHAATLVPLLVTAPGLVVAVLAPIAGILVDRFGRRALLLLATLLYAVVGTAPLVLSQLGAIAASRVLVGGCEAFVVICTNALLADYFDPRRRRFWLTVQGLVFPLFAAAVAALTGRLTLGAWNGAFAAYALVLPIGASVFLYCPEPALRQTIVMTARRDFPWRAASLVCAVTLLVSMLFYVYIVQIGLAYAAVGVVSSATIGRDIGLTTLSAPIGALLFNLLSRRFQAEVTLAICVAGMGVGLAVIGFAHNPATVLVGSVVQQGSAAMMIPTMILWVSHVFAPHHRGRAFGFWSSASFASQFLSALLVGAMRGVVGGILPIFAIIGIAGLIGAAALATIARRPLTAAASA